MPSSRPKSRHFDSLESVCIFCHRKAPGRRKISETHKKYIIQNHYSDFKKHERYLPKVECGNCHLSVCDKIKNGDKSKRELPIQNFLETYRKLRPKNTRPIKVCRCFVCVIARENCVTKKSKTATVPKPKKTKKCEKCYAEVSPGKHKSCGITERVQNLMENVSPRTRMKLCLETIKEEQNKAKSSGPIKVSTYGGPKVSISINAPSQSHLSQVT